MLRSARFDVGSTKVVAVVTRNTGMDGIAGNPSPAVMPELPLTHAPQGQPLELTRIQSGGRLAYRLATMGMTPGTRLKLEAGGRRGPLLISLGTSRLILGHGLAERVLVRAIEEGQG